MEVLIAYASRYGSTRQLADTIADQLAGPEITVDVQEASNVQDLERYDAYVIGSATYIGHWLPDAADLVRDHEQVLRSRPTWLFSSGPLGDEDVDARGRPLREVAAPAEFDEFALAIEPRDHAVFFGALVPSKLSFRDRSVRRLPVGRELLPAGDFRDLDEVGGWAAGIAEELHRQVSTAEDPEPA